jgi:glyoxylase-like metal-dependent hydrolase (beta-lactamase superfamily II)
MTKSIKWLAIFLLSLPTYAQQEEAKYPEVTVEVNYEKLTSGSYYIKGNAGTATDSEGFISTSGFVVTSAGVVVYDALGTPALANKMVSLIRSVTDKPITKVVVSHYHADHIYGLQVFKALGAEIIAPKGAIEYIESDSAELLLSSRRVSLYPYVNEDTKLVVPDVVIKNNETYFKVGDHEFYIIYHGPVHSEGDMSLYNKTDKVLFIGDLIFEGRIPFVGDADIRKWIIALDSIRNSRADMIVPGHGEVSEWPLDLTDLVYRYLNFMLSQVEPAVEEMMEFDEFYDSVDWSEFSDEIAFEATNRKNALAVYLQIERE